MTWYEITGIVLLVVIVGPVVLGFAMHRESGDPEFSDAVHNEEICPCPNCVEIREEYGS